MVLKPSQIPSMTDITNAALMVTVALVVILITVLISVEFSLGRRRASFPRITLPNAPIASSSLSSPSVPAFNSPRALKYDVFLSFRGEDTRRTFVDHLYYALNRRQVRTYKDDETLPRGDTISSSLMNAIADSQFAIIIFSENYANSSWCLDELKYIMKCNKEGGIIVMPIFYHVNPMDVRKQKGKYEEAFAKHKSDNRSKVESWRKALIDASNTAGWEINHNVNGHEAKAIEDIVGNILDKLLSLSSVADENLVGMGTRLQDLISRLEIVSGGVRMVGICGIGGGGKTALATSLYMEIRGKFGSCCFVDNIQQTGLKILQEKILSSVFHKKLEIESVDIGKNTIKGLLRSRNVLIVLDDVDDYKQLEALAGSHDWFGDGSRIIITTRDEHLLRIHRVDEVSRVSLLSDEEAIRLFNKRAYNENKHVENYNTLSQRVVSYSAGLPLALIVLGSFLYDKNKDEWISTLDRLKDIPEKDIVEKLKISYDGLKPLEKELFLDIVCFFRGRKKDEAMEMLDACGFHPVIGIKVLVQKALITILDGEYFEMHDMVAEMGHYIVRGEHPNNSEKHSRLWRSNEIKDMCSRNTTTEIVNLEAIDCFDCPSNIGKLVSNAKKLRSLSVRTFNNIDIQGPCYLSNELRYMFWESYPASPFPESFQPRKLVILRLKRNLQKELWRGYKHLPCLRELDICFAYHLVRTPDFGGLPCLQKLTLYACENLEEIHPSLGNHTSLVSVHVERCRKLRKFPKFNSNDDRSENLPFKDDGIVGDYCSKLRSLRFVECSIPHLSCFLRRLTLSKCDLKDGEIPRDIANLSNLQELNVSGNGISRLNFSLLQLSRLKLLNLNWCWNLVELPELPTSIAILKADWCISLEVVGDIITTNCRWLSLVSLRNVRSVIGGHRLLQSMLEGNAIENGCMRLQLKGVEIPNRFRPRLLRGDRYRMQLPENWYNHFSGFLICATVDTEQSKSYKSVQSITMKHEDGGMDSEQDVHWEESVDDDDDDVVQDTWVGYVSFGSLKETTWWDQASTGLMFSFRFNFDYGRDSLCRGIGVSLVSKAKKLETRVTDSSSESSDDDYTCNFRIGHYSKSHLIYIFES